MAVATPSSGHADMHAKFLHHYKLCSLTGIYSYLINVAPVRQTPMSCTSTDYYIPSLNEKKVYKYIHSTRVCPRSHATTKGLHNPNAGMARNKYINKLMLYHPKTRRFAAS